LNPEVNALVGFLPYSEQIAGASGVTHKFTGYKRDGETSEGYANARHYSSTLGRFMTPDSIGISAADLTNPQTWNQYAFLTAIPAISLTPPALTANAATCPAAVATTGAGILDSVAATAELTTAVHIWAEQIPI